MHGDHRSGSPAVTNAAADNALDLAGAAFNQMMTGSAPLTLDGTALGPDFPPRDLDLIELRRILVGEAADGALRDTAWAELVRRSRADGPEWALGCVGVALPMLVVIAARATQGAHAAQADDIVSELLVGFLGGLAGIDPHRGGVLPRLGWHARRAANRARHQAARETVVAPEQLRAQQQPRPGGHVDLALADAVRRGTITGAEARIISATRLLRRPCTQVAAEFGLSYEALMKRRHRAETRLAAELSPRDLARLMSRNRP